MTHVDSCRIPILLLTNSLHVGGAERHTVFLANHLDDAKFSISLAYLKRDEGLLPHVLVERLDVLFCCDVAGRLDRRAIAKLVTHIDHTRPTTVFCANYYSFLYGLAARRRSDHKPALVLIYHTTVLRSLKEKLQAAFYRRLVRHADLLIYVCENQRRYWRARGLRPKHDTVIHNGIDPQFFTDSFTTEAKVRTRRTFEFGAADYVVGLCAVMRPEKAHTDLLEAIARLRQDGLPIKALFIGDGPERPRIEARRRQLQLDSAVQITGFQKDVRPFVATCDVMALPSHAIETFSLSVLESMSMGKPTVLTRIGGADEQVIPDYNGFLYEPGDINALASHLRTLADSQTRTSMGRAAAQIVRERFTLDQMIARYAAIASALPRGDQPEPHSSSQA